MGSHALIPQDDLENLGPAMQALTQLQRNFVTVYLEHSNWSAASIAREAGYADTGDACKVRAHTLVHDERVIAAINEQASKLLRRGGSIGVQGLMALALNPNHKDHLKACIAIMDRTGFHAMSEHKVTVDDKRPQSKKEMIDRVKLLAEELGLGQEAIKKMTGEDVVDVEFKEVDDVQLLIDKQMEEL
jgi:hypothetical protein